MSVYGFSRVFVAVYGQEITARSREVITLSRGFRFLCVWWRFFDGFIGGYRRVRS